VRVMDPVFVAGLLLSIEKDKFRNTV
jgi:hypothetical protein